MRFLFGMIVGVLLTVGSAWWFDASHRGDGARRPMVNWDVVEAQLGALSASVQDGWSRLAGRKPG